MSGVPLELELEDRLIYGLSAQRFGYLVVAGLAAAGIWSRYSMPGAIRLALCVVPLTVAAVLAWGRWRSRGLDLYLYDASFFLVRNYRLEVVRQRLPVSVKPASPDSLGFDPNCVCTAPGLEWPSRFG